MAKRDFAFGKENFILIAVAVAVIAIGFMLMSGGGSQDPTGFNPEILGFKQLKRANAGVQHMSAAGKLWLPYLFECQIINSF